MAARIIVEHLSGARRGQRREFAVDEIVRFGRHPDSEVSFHAHRDIDASSRHAELRRRDGNHVLRDVGSSNGTFVAGERVHEAVLEPDTSHLLGFGADGPRVRVYIGDPDSMPPAPADIDEERAITGGYLATLAISVAVIIAVAVVAWLVLV